MRREPSAVASARQLAASAVHGSSAAACERKEPAAAVEFRVAAVR